MTRGKRIVAAALGGALLLATGFSPARAEDATIAPMGAVSFDLGARRLVSYFLRDDARCNLTVMIADRAENAEAAKVARLQVTVAAGRSARLDTADGASASFVCGDDAASMRVIRIEQLAASVTH